MSDRTDAAAALRMLPPSDWHATWWHRLSDRQRAERILQDLPYRVGLLAVTLSLSPKCGSIEERDMARTCLGSALSDLARVGRIAVDYLHAETEEDEQAATKPKRKHKPPPAKGGAA